MESKEHFTLYLSPTGKHCFLVPADHPLPAGNFLVRPLNGDEQAVDFAALAAFEISRDTAQEHLHSILSQRLAQAGAAFSSLLNLAGFAESANSRNQNNGAVVALSFSWLFR